MLKRQLRRQRKPRLMLLRKNKIRSRRQSSKQQRFRVPKFRQKKRSLLTKQQLSRIDKLLMSKKRHMKLLWGTKTSLLNLIMKITQVP